MKLMKRWQNYSSIKDINQSLENGNSGISMDLRFDGRTFYSQVGKHEINLKDLKSSDLMLLLRMEVLIYNYRDIASIFDDNMLALREKIPSLILSIRDKKRLSTIRERLNDIQFATYLGMYGVDKSNILLATPGSCEITEKIEEGNTVILECQERDLFPLNSALLSTIRTSGKSDNLIVDSPNPHKVKKIASSVGIICN